MQCLVTKLKESVVNDNLLKLGEFVLKFEKSENEDVTKRYIEIASVGEVILKLKGDAYFIDAVTNESNGKEVKIPGNTTLKRYYVSNEACEVCISNKYKIVTVNINNPCISGKINFLNGMEGLSTLLLNESNIIGNTSVLKGLTNAVSVNIRTNGVHGELSDISQLKKIRALNLESSAIRGNISDLLEMKELADCSLKKVEVLGDISTLQNSVAFLSTQKGISVLEWKKERSNDAKIIALEGVRLGDDVDRMFINQAKCVAAPLKENIWYNQIQVYGNRTSASDEAVETLKSKGYKIMVNDATL